ncbi:MAG TPA: HAMP domain-containing methyl-accepting chemotaxis protein [Candidatus Saccharimonadales bacterium]|nr:HAMP domain-containing methyl-accepting chemotaxis protein [Candidatus Saccharimonadales bacterium]
MTIRQQLYKGFGVVLGMLALLLIVDLGALWSARRANQEAAGTLETVRTAESVRYQIMQNRLNLNNFLLSGDPRDEDKVNRGFSELSDLVKRGQSQTGSEALRTALIQVESTEASWADNFAKPLLAKRHQVDSGDATVSDLQIFYLQKDPASWLAKSSAVLDQANSDISKALADSQKAASNANLWSGIIVVLGTLVAIGFGAFSALRTANSITHPLEHLITVAQEIGDSGDLDQNIDIHRNDEIGALATTFNNMVAYLKEMASVSMAVAEGDLTVEVVPRSKRDTLGNAFQRMAHGLQEIVRNTRDAASQVSAGSNQVAGAADESAKVGVQASSAIEEVTSTMHEMSINVQNVVKNTQVQASSVAETSASIDQMVTSIQRVADTAKVLLDIANRSREEVVTGIQTMEKATDGLNRTNRAIQSSAEIINILGHRADDIGKIIEVIDDLAEQTNLLALNAAIEAARAGEHGLGFAVVADEVRKLAEKSTQSTKEIADLIQSIQREARQAVENMEHSTRIVEEGLSLGNDLGSALHKISDVVTEVYKFSQEIGAATNEQSVGSSQIARATNRLTEITQEINSAVEEQASGAQAVVRAMDKMRELVQQSASSSTELSAAAEQMLKLSRNLLDNMDRFVIDRSSQARARRDGASARRPAAAHETREYEMAEVRS